VIPPRTGSNNKAGSRPLKNQQVLLSSQGSRLCMDRYVALHARQTASAHQRQLGCKQL